MNTKKVSQQLANSENLKHVQISFSMNEQNLILV